MPMFKKSHNRILRLLHKFFSISVVIAGSGALITLLNYLLGNLIWDFASPVIYSVLERIDQSIEPVIQAYPQILPLSALTILIATILIVSYLETRPPMGLIVDNAIQKEKQGIMEGIRVINNTGYDLYNCFIDLVWANTIDFSRTELNWWGNLSKVDIPHTQNQSVYIVFVWNLTRKASLVDFKGPRIPLGKTELELIFRGANKAGKAFTLDFWITLQNSETDEGNNVSITKIKQ